MERVLYRPPPVALGPPPWSRETLEQAANTNFAATQEALDTHPAREIAERLASIAAVLRLFHKAGNAVLAVIQLFHREAHYNNLFQRTRRDARQDLEEQLQEQLYVFAASAMTLVDQTRALSKKVSLPGYRELIESSFAGNPRHRFIQELRVDMIHVTLHAPSLRLTSGAEEDRTTTFLLHANQLPRLSEYHALARKFVASNPAGIDIAALVREYTDDVDSLHQWLTQAIEKCAGETLADLRRCQAIVAGVGSRTWWRLVLNSLFIQGGRDPYSYLDQYLTPEELQTVNALPHRSTAQVDRIIAFIDEEGACNEELRQLTYRAFAVGGP